MMCFAPPGRAFFPHLNSQKWPETLSILTLLRHKLSERVCFWHFDFEICFASTAWIFWTLQLPKVVRTCMVCLEHFDFEMCFAPKLRALFEHLKFQKWSEHAVLSSFLLWYVLFATTAYTFWTSQLPRALQEWGFSSVLTFKSASRHKGMPFFISHLTRWLRTRRFSEPTFPLLSDSISSLIFFLLRFSCLTLPTSAASSVHILRSLAFKLPSIFTSHYASVCAHILLETDVSVYIPYSTYTTRTETNTSYLSLKSPPGRTQTPTWQNKHTKRKYGAFNMHMIWKQNAHNTRKNDIWHRYSH